MNGAKEYISAIAREVEEWPGAEVNFALSARHQIAELSFKGRVTRHYFPTTPSDVRGLRNCISDVRKTLKNLGAWRIKTAASPHRNRSRNKPDRGLLVSMDPAPVMPSPFAALAQIAKDIPMTRQIEINGKTITLETGKVPAARTIGRDKGPIRLLCEQMQDGESAFLPLEPEVIQKANLSGIGKAVGAKFSYRQEDNGVRIFRFSPPASKGMNDTSSVTPMKKASGW